MLCIHGYKPISFLFDGQFFKNIFVRVSSCFVCVVAPLHYGFLLVLTLVMVDRLFVPMNLEAMLSVASAPDNSVGDFSAW